MKYLGKTPEVEITPRAYQKMMAYVEAAEKSVGWIMEITVYDKEEYLIEDVFLIPQKVNYSDATLDSKFYSELDTSKLCYSGVGYSTVNATTVPTSADMNRFNALMKDVPWYIGVQMNKKGEFNLFFYDKLANMIFDNLDWSYSLDVYLTKDDAKKEIEKYVTSSYGSTYAYSGQSTWKDTGSYAYGTKYTAPKKEYPPSELASKKPDISSLT